MAVTPGGTPYVESSDLVANYPAVSLALAEHIDDLPAAILQVVRATDSTNRSTTSTSYVDANLSVTITPQKSNSRILLLVTNNSRTINNSSAAPQAYLRISDNSNNAISGAEEMLVGGAVSGAASSQFEILASLLGYSTPATTSATTYKLRFRVEAATTTYSIRNAFTTGQLYAIEVSA